MNIRDIAKIAKVGVSTVSRVLNDHPDVKAETRARVLKVIKDNNYIPNNSARVLKQMHTRNIGILVKGVFNPFFSEIIKIMSVDIEGAGYITILQYHNNENDIDTLLGFIKEKKLQGVICLGGNFLELNDEVLESLDVMVVLVSVDLGAKKELKRCSSISINNKQAAYMGTEYLIRSGHKKIALMLGNDSDIGVSQERYDGYRLALKAYDIPFDERRILYGNYECITAFEEMSRLIESPIEVTAIFAISDMMAVGSAKAISKSGYIVGKDISVLGFDGMEVASFYQPTIATIRQPRQELGKIGSKLLLSLLEGQAEHEHIFLDVELIEGDSCQSI